MTDHRKEYLKNYYHSNKEAYRIRAKKFRDKRKAEDMEFVKKWKENKLKIN